MLPILILPALSLALGSGQGLIGPEAALAIVSPPLDPDGLDQQSLNQTVNQAVNQTLNQTIAPPDASHPHSQPLPGLDWAAGSGLAHVDTRPSPSVLAQVDSTGGQTDPSGVYEQLFVPQHRRQSGRTPFVPKDLPLNSDNPEDDTPASPNYAGSPSNTISVPSAYGASWRSFGVGLGVQSRARFTNRADGGIGVGTGFGSPETIGLQVGISFVDVSDPLADGSVSLKLHRQLPYDVAIALGATGVLTWGGPDGGSSIYGVASKRFTLGDVGQPLSQITTSFGLGSGQFRSESQINRDVNAVGAFGSVSLRVIEPVSAIVEWTGQDLNLGVSVVPFRSIPLVLTPAISDVTGRAGDGARFILGVGYGTQF